MSQDELKNLREGRRFLLGEMTDAERSAFEQRFVADEDLFEQTRVCEDELIEAYAREMLSATEREKFERAFLTTERRRERVVFTRQMLRQFAGEKEIAVAKKTEAAAGNTSVRDSIIGFFKTPGLAFGAALAILLLIFGGWLILRNANKTEIAQQNNGASPTPFETILPKSNQSLQPSQNAAINSEMQTPEIAETNKINSEQKKAAPEKNSNARNLNSQPKEERNAPIVNPVFALVAGTVRSEGKTQQLSLPKNAGTVSLLLNLESTDYKIYSAEIVDADGNIVYSNNNLKAKNSKINFSVSAAKLTRGDYVVKLSARNSNNETESVADYAFRVNRK